MSSPDRTLAILGLFSGERPVWQPDAINAALGYSRPTGYRYVKALVTAGLLHRLEPGLYSLGPRIIELDYQLRQSDPILLASQSVMERLAQHTGFDAVLSMMFPGPRVVDIYRAAASSRLKLSYGRGRPRPAFRSSAPKVLLAGLPRAQLVRIYRDCAHEIEASGLGSTWAEFRASVATIRRQGYYQSHGELERGIGGLAVPLHNAQGETLAALALVGTVRQFRQAEQPALLAQIGKARHAIENKLANSTAPSYRTLST
jgi:DNA-binding IclR family transcriptional regulator